MVKMYVQTPLKFWFHIKFSREYDYVNEYPYSAKLQNMTCWTESGTQSSHIKGLDKCVWCWVCSVLSKQRGEVVWWARGVRFTKANCGQESQWPYTDCGPAVTGMFASCYWACNYLSMQGLISNHASKSPPPPDGFFLLSRFCWSPPQCSDVIMSVIAPQITSLTIFYSTVYSGVDKKKTSKLRVTGLCEGNSPVTGEFTAQRASNAEMFPFDGVIMHNAQCSDTMKSHAFPSFPASNAGLLMSIIYSASLSS